jgi:hypothetical protein
LRIDKTKWWFGILKPPKQVGIFVDFENVFIHASNRGIKIGVATGTKAGVSIGPEGVSKIPARARDFFKILKENI